MSDPVDDFVQALLSIDRFSAESILENQGTGISTAQLIEDMIVSALERIGKEWRDGTVALSQVYMAGRICEDMVNRILPPGHPNRKNQPKMAIGVLSDHHKLGKIIVFSLLRASGYDLMDYGTIELDDLVERITADRIEIILVSVLMLSSALQIKNLREKLDETGRHVKIIVGGAPFRFDDALWKEVGADAMCRTASEVFHVIHNMKGGSHAG